MQDNLPWLSLKSVPGVGNLIFKRLIDRFGSPKAVFRAAEGELARVKGLSRRVLSSIRKHQTPDWARKELDLVEQKGCRIVTLTDPQYPPLLSQIPDPPPYLYVYGTLDTAVRTVSVVGSRNATDYGISITRRLCADLAACGATIVSGMARGIDTAAHKGALAAGGKTIAEESMRILKQIESKLA